MPQIKPDELELVLQSLRRGCSVAETLVAFGEPILTADGTSYVARACGAERPDGLWEGWVEFTSGGSAVVRTGRETTQPNRQDLLYWATGLTPVYLEGSLHRALTPVIKRPAAPMPPPAFDAPAPATVPPPGTTSSILNPFSVFRKGEPLLRRQLGAFSKWHLLNIISDHGLSGESTSRLELLDESVLIELIIAGVKLRAETPAPR